MSLTPSTERQAVNAMLAAIGEAPVNSLSGQVVSEVSLAQQVLSDVNREVQTVGWHFNTVPERTLTPDGSSNLQRPSNALKVQVHYSQAGTYDLVVRGGLLYDRKNDTSTFTSNVKVSVTIGLAWTDLPEYARRYIFVRATRKFVQDVLGERDLYGYSAQDELTAKSEFEDEDASLQDHNIWDQGNSPTVSRWVDVAS